MAYGFEEQHLNSQHLLVKGGVTSSFHSLLALLPEHQVGVFVSYNSDGGGLALSPLLQAFLDHYFPAPKETRPSPPAGFAERISQVSGTYWTTRHSYTTYEKLLTPFSADLSVTDGGNGRLVIGQTTFVEVAPWVFHQVDGQQTVVFRADPNGMLMLIGNEPIEAFIKLAWYDAPTLHLVLVVACVLVFLSALLLWPLGFVRRAMRRGARSKQSSRNADREGAQTPPQDSQGKPPLSRWGRLPDLSSWLAGVLCALNVLFLILLLLFLFGLGSASYPVIFRGVTPLLTTLFALALVSAVLAAGSVVGTILAWWGRFWSVGRRVHYTLVALAALAFAGELLYWNLLGFRA